MGGGSKIEVVSKSKKMSFFVGIFFLFSENKKAHFLGFGDIRWGGQFSIVSRRQNMSFFYFASIPYSSSDQVYTTIMDKWNRYSFSVRLCSNCSFIEIE